MSYRYPYGNTEQMNLDWFLKQWEAFKADWAEAEAGIDGSLDAEIAKVEAAMSELYAARDAAAASATAARQSSLDAAAAQVAAGNSKTAAQAAETSARGSQQAAAESAQEAQASATGAENSALTATQAANTATQQAAGADVAKGAAEAAQQAAEAAQAAAAQSAGQAGQAATAAADHADDAADSATLAQQAAQDMSDSVDQITTNKNDISDLKESTNDLKTAFIQLENKTDAVIEPTTSLMSGTTTTGKSINYSGDVADANTNYYVISFAITGGDQYIVNGAASNSGYLYIFRDGNATVLSKSEQNTSGSVKSYSDVLATAPTSATELVVASHSSTSYTQASAYHVIGYDVIGFPQVQEKVNSINIKPSITEFITYTDTSGKAINYTGYPADTGSSFHVASVSVVAGEKYLLLGACNDGAGNYRYAFYDNNDNLISGLQGSGTGINIFEANVTVPSNATTMRLNWHSSYNPAGAVVEKILTFCADSYGWSGLKWVCLGDSITANNVASDKHYFDYIHDRTGIVTVNMGIGGTGYWRGYDSNTAFYQRAANIPACDVITIFGSNNDTVSGSVLGNVTDTTTETVAGCINTTLSTIFTNHPVTPVGIIAPIPVGDKITTNVGNTLEVYSELLGEIASYRGVPFLDLYHTSNLRPQDATQRALLYSNEVIDGYTDATHPNNAGQKYIYPHFLEFIKTLI